MTLSKDAILAADDIRQEVVEVPEWGGSVVVRGLSGLARDEWEAWCVQMREAWGQSVGGNIRASLLVHALFDTDGKQLFTTEDIERLGTKSGLVIERLYSVAAKLSGVTASDENDLKKS